MSECGISECSVGEKGLLWQIVGNKTGHAYWSLLLKCSKLRQHLFRPQTVKTQSRGHTWCEDIFSLAPRVLYNLGSKSRDFTEDDSLLTMEDVTIFWPPFLRGNNELGLSDGKDSLVCFHFPDNQTSYHWPAEVTCLDQHTCRGISFHVNTSMYPCLYR